MSTRAYRAAAARARATRRGDGSWAPSASCSPRATFHESTVEEVADRAGVSRATLYQHFRSRLGLVDAICETFDENPALVALQGVTGVDEFIARAVEFWATRRRC